MINFIGISKSYPTRSWEEFLDWEKQQEAFQLDIETDVSPYWCNKKLISVQFGTVTPDIQWVLQWSQLNDEQRLHIKSIIEGDRLKIIHHAVFETVVLRFYGMLMKNVYDTMVVEKILLGGIDTGGYSLADCVFKYLYLPMDKTEQTTFGDDILTTSKIEYAATDVKHMGVIREAQMKEIIKWKLEKVLELENEAVLAFSDITYYGMELDRNKWKANEELAQPIVDASYIILNEWLLVEPFKSKAIDLGYISEEDRVVINFGSPPQKTALLKRVVPDIESSAKLIVKKYIRDNGPKLSTEVLSMLLSLQEKEYNSLQEILLRDHREWLIQEEFLIPALKPTINWNSVDQVLPLMQQVAPRIKNMSEETLSNVNHQLVEDLGNYKDSLKLVNTYGQKFLDNHVEPDGKVRTNFNQIIVTGRVSSFRPNMQNIPAKEAPKKVADEWLLKNPEKSLNELNYRYRNAFVCGSDEVFVDSDFTGQELAIIAHISKDPVWFKAIEQGLDLHSICAEMVYGIKWLSAKADNCEYYKILEDGTIAKQKCKCPGHKTLRNAVKTVNFGLAYGMGDMGLSNKVKISVPEAKTLIDQYFKTFPSISGTLKFLGEFGVKNGYIQTLSPYFRKRWFPFWKFARSRIDYHLAGQHDGTLGEIERASKNQPIQGCGADMMKLAMVYVRRYIVENNMQDKIRIVAQVHDQLTTICRKDVQESWKSTFDQLMQDAAKVIIPSGILKADTQITPYWTK